MAKKHLWQSVFNELSADIRDRDMRPGDKFFSLDEICARFDVSTITARRALHELQNEGWIKKFRRRGTFVARSHLLTQLDLVANYSLVNNGITVEDGGFVVVRFIDELRRIADKASVELQLRSSRYGSSGVRGRNLILIEGAFLSQDTLRSLCRDNNVVLAHVLAPVDYASTVCLDIGKGVSLAVRHLAGQGHSRIGLFLTKITNNWMVPRFEAYKAALKRCRLAFDWRLVGEAVNVDRGSVFETMNRIMSSTEPPTAMIASNDEMALTIMDYCRERDIAVPQRLSIIGCDNGLDGANAQPSLTTLETHLDMMAERSFLMLMDMAAERRPPSSIKVSPELVMRGSTAPPAAGS